MLPSARFNNLCTLNCICKIRCWEKAVKRQEVKRWAATQQKGDEVLGRLPVGGEGATWQNLPRSPASLHSSSRHRSRQKTSKCKPTRLESSCSSPSSAQPPCSRTPFGGQTAMPPTLPAGGRLSSSPAWGSLPMEMH